MTTPNWEPLETFMNTPACIEADHSPEEFMWMGTTAGIETYKHRETRRTLNLDSEGQTYKFNPHAKGHTRAGYKPIPADQAIYHVFS